jgi:hypothetical protein
MKASFAHLEAEKALAAIGYGPCPPFDGVNGVACLDDLFTSISRVRDTLFELRRGPEGFAERPIDLVPKAEKKPARRPKRKTEPPAAPPSFARMIERLELATRTLRSHTTPPAKNNRRDKQPAKEPAGRPHWDRTSWILSFGDLQYQYEGREAPAQFAILDLLEESGWPPKGIMIPKDFPHSVKDTLESLNPRTIAIGLSLRHTDKNRRILWKKS